MGTLNFGQLFSGLFDDEVYRVRHSRDTIQC